MNVCNTDRDVDVFIAGAGPAGLACAIAAAGQGFHVEVADGRKPPIDKACGEGLMPDTLAALTQLGIDLDHPSTQELLQSASHPLRGIRFIGGSNTSEASPLNRFLEVEHVAPKCFIAKSVKPEGVPALLKLLRVRFKT